MKQITEGELQAVADASSQFDHYLVATYGKDDMARAQDRADRGDATFEEVLLKKMREMHQPRPSFDRRDDVMPTSSKDRSSKKSRKKDREPSSSSSDSSD